MKYDKLNEMSSIRRTCYWNFYGDWNIGMWKKLSVMGTDLQPYSLHLVNYDFIHNIYISFWLCFENRSELR